MYGTYTSPLLHWASFCAIGKDVFMTISNLYVSENKGFGFFFSTFRSRECFHAGRKEDTCWWAVSYLSSILFLEKTLVLAFSKETIRKIGRPTTWEWEGKISFIQIWILYSPLLFSFENASVTLFSQPETWWLSQHHSRQDSNNGLKN